MSFEVGDRVSFCKDGIGTIISLRRMNDVVGRFQWDWFCTIGHIEKHPYHLRGIIEYTTYLSSVEPISAPKVILFENDYCSLK